ncbi:DUF4382 domain-containing protein [Salinimicrobium xinjiangense]|uniref:DUF4382 domain-containing protein n=1 Tax=Salinimicrobium xinjiangense TaxID=438596 RepID=UPI0004112C52|nr:DUF4382 domain-containing protein [Salinimicrobium xinjiangense]
MKLNSLLKLFLLVLFAGTIASCSTDDDDATNGSEQTYATKVYITDAPVDNPEVTGTFITVSEVRVNGKAIENFQKTTIEISSFTNGKTELLGELNLEAGTTSDIVLVLSETDASGNGSGNYVLTADGQKHALTQTATEISVADSAEILASAENQLVLDFDLRKSITSGAENAYTFSSAAQLRNSVRAVNTLKAGTITGNVSNMGNYDSEQMLVFAYKKGDYNDSEKNPNSGGVRFANAVSSSVVNNSDGKFSLHFMEAGEYELYFHSYADDNNDGKLEFEGQLEMAGSGNLNLNSVNVDANSTVSVEVLFNGFLNL